MDFYRCSNTHDPDQDGFEDLYRRDFIHAISRIACRKLACHQLNPYQHATFCRSIIRHNTGEEEANPTLELAMEYTCQGITPSNSKGGLPAPEAGARAQKGNDYKPSKLSKQSEELSRQSRTSSSRVNPTTEGVEGRARPGGPT